MIPVLQPFQDPVVSGSAISDSEVDGTSPGLPSPPPKINPGQHLIDSKQKLFNHYLEFLEMKGLIFGLIQLQQHQGWM